jgi:hypothetical protein
MFNLDAMVQGVNIEPAASNRLDSVEFLPQFRFSDISRVFFSRSALLSFRA